MNNLTRLLCRLRVDSYLAAMPAPLDVELGELALIELALTPPRLSYDDMDELWNGWDFLAYPQGPLNN